MKSRYVLIGLISLSMLLCGCISTKVYTKVGKDGVIERYRVEMTINSLFYTGLKEYAKSQGYSSVKDYMIANFSKMLKGEISYDERWEKDQVTIIVEAKNAIPQPNSRIKISKEGNYLIFRDLSFKSNESSNMSKAFLGTLRLDYYLEMPGKIVDSNANVVRENKAEWHLTGTDALNTEIYAKSEVPSIPGMELAIGILGLSIGLLAFRKRLS